MGKFSELDLAIKDLRSAAATINEVANTLAEMFSTASADEAPVAATPAEPVLTLEQVRAVLADKSRMGFTAEIRSLLQKYGAAKLSGIDPANYKALVADAEVLGDGN
ncbi:MAG: DNA ligase [Clostridia bacterium]|nr:DNA ligase [Clostridia bacterium]